MTQLQNTVTISKVTDKISGKVLGYLVPSDTKEGVTYQVAWNETITSWQCNCEAGKHGRPCRHTRGVSSLIAAQMTEKRNQAALNGNRAFSLMR